MSSPIAAQPHPDKVLPFDGPTIKQSIWWAVPECLFFCCVLVPGAFVWLAWQRVRRSPQVNEEQS